MKTPEWLSMHAWYLPHQAWLRDQGVRHHNPEGALPVLANLSDTHLSDANLSGANLSGADLRRAHLWCANLSGADLRRANLRWANLSGADLWCANLSGADLRRADLRCANLSGAHFSGANLSDTDLSGADLSRARLSGTILAPGAAIPKTDLSAFSAAPDGRLIGWRTRRSQCVGSTVYTPGVHRAPWFSMDIETECHPGIYVCPTRESAMEINSDVVRVLFRSEGALRAGRKYRVRELEVVE